MKATTPHLTASEPGYPWLRRTGSPEFLSTENCFLSRTHTLRTNAPRRLQTSEAHNVLTVSLAFTIQEQQPTGSSTCVSYCSSRHCTPPAAICHAMLHVPTTLQHWQAKLSTLTARGHDLAKRQRRRMRKEDRADGEGDAVERLEEEVGGGPHTAAHCRDCTPSVEVKSDSRDAVEPTSTCFRSVSR